MIGPQPPRRPCDRRATGAPRTGRFGVTSAEWSASTRGSRAVEANGADDVNRERAVDPAAERAGVAGFKSAARGRRAAPRQTRRRSLRRERAARVARRRRRSVRRGRSRRAGHVVEASRRAAALDERLPAAGRLRERRITTMARGDESSRSSMISASRPWRGEIVTATASSGGWRATSQAYNSCAGGSRPGTRHARSDRTASGRGSGRDRAWSGGPWTTA